MPVYDPAETERRIRNVERHLDSARLALWGLAAALIVIAAAASLM